MSNVLKSKTIIKRPTEPSFLSEDQLPSKKEYIHNSNTYTISIDLFQEFGSVQIRWRNNGPIGKFDFVALYEGYVPSDPNTGYSNWQWVTDSQGTFNTEKQYGSNWTAAYVAWDFELGKYVVVTKVGPTS
ncbi:hypothetical protein CXF68_18315 [Tenacibaculum sp. Bg11-29]|uniref:hypothetical protein n=1 Tax=Tenacibaculum sp. Bg11-29 TaxID=2058306 RepID=UPI000C347B9F|nr:hypothetical protein [Tenacibaculum sp. Bg11-29]PKH52531.1 hypothetical protein CXF68_18315 [Tenacibaculum sp. Bg11-29]